MKTSLLKKIVVVLICVSFLSACAIMSKKRGCKTSVRNMGAERIEAGEAGKKKEKFKIKGLDKAYQQ